MQMILITKLFLFQAEFASQISKLKGFLGMFLKRPTLLAWS